MIHPSALALLCSLALPSSVLAQGTAAAQELYVYTPDGDVYRVDNYASNPTPVLVGNSGGANQGVGIHPTTGLASSCDAVSLTTSPIYAWDAAFTPQLIGTAFIPLGNGMDYDQSGALLAVGAVSAGIYNVDPATGQSTIMAVVSGMQPDGDVAIGVDGRVHVATSFSRLATYDPSTGQSMVQNHTGTTGVISGFEIDVDGVGYMARASGDFYSFDLTTLVATQIGNLGFSCTDLAFTIPADAPQGPGTSYCSPAVANSTGAPGQIHALGSNQVIDNDLVLVADQLPLQSAGIFLNSLTQAVTPMAGGSQGTLCLGGGIGRYVGPGQVQNSGPTGSFLFALDLTQHPTPMGLVSVLPGETWNFQAWYRDMNPGNTSNFTDAWTVVFQ